MMGFFKRKKYKCLVCEKGVGESSPIVRYRYGNGETGEARLCNKCANKFDKVELEDNADGWSV